MEKLPRLATSLVLWAVPALAAGALVPAASDYINHQRWLVRDGLVQQTVTDVLQTSNGYLWLTTYGGLARFDGVRFQTYQLADVPQLGTNKLVSLFEDSAGNLWIGTVEGGVVRRDSNGFHAFGKAGTPQLDIQDFAEDATGQIWVAGHGLSRLTSGPGRREFEPVTRPAWLSGTEVGDLLVTDDGTLWAATARGLLKREAEEFVLVNDSPPARGARGLVEDTAGRLWLITPGGISYLEGGELVSVHTLDEPVYSAILDEDGSVLAGTASGLLRATTDAAGRPAVESVVLPSDDESLQSGVTALFRDHAGNVWAGTNALGLIRINRVAYAQYEDPRGLQHSSVLRLARDWNGGVWLQGQEGWLLHGSAGTVTDPAGSAGWEVPSGAVLLGATRDGAVWLNQDDIVLRAHGSIGAGFKTQQYLQRIGRGLVEARDGSVWFGGEGGVHVFDDGTFTAHALPDITGPVRPQLEASDGSIWFIADGAVGRIIRDGPSIVTELIGQDNRLMQVELRSLREDSNGNLWLSTYGHGLLRIQGRQLQHIGKAQGLPELSLGGILEDASGRLWINSNRGLLVIPLPLPDDDSDLQIRPRLLGSPETNGPAAVADNSGFMWFPTVRGLIVVDPDRYQPDPTPPVVHIEQVLLDGQLAAVGTSTRVPAGVQSITVDYTGIWLRQPELVRFQYRLSGYQDEWVDAGPRRTAFFTKVPPGEYQFEVAAISGDGVRASTRGPMPIVVEARYYQTMWFKVVVLLVIIALSLGLHRYRVANAQRNTRALRQEIINRRRAERERALMERSLMESSRMESIGRLAGGIAHDFNNVLTAVLGHAEQAQENLRGDRAELESHLKGIVGCSERAAALTRQLLAFSRQQVLMPKTVNANKVVESLQPMLRQLLPENVLLEWMPLLHLPSVTVDPSQLEQVVMNLVLNARDAMPDGGTITIATRAKQVTEELVWPTSGVSPGSYVEIEISDSGHGMNPEVLARVFDPFFTTKPPGHGTGLGLASVHGIVAQSGGHVKVDSTPLQGTRFSVLLPVVDADATREEGDEDASAISLDGTEQVLVCEDDDAIRAMLIETLRGRGYHVRDTSHPAQVLELLRNGRLIDLLITDIMLPGINGYDLAERVRQSCPAAAALFISGYAENRYDRAAHDGAYLQKPFKPSQLLQLVRQVLNKRHEQRYARMA